LRSFSTGDGDSASDESNCGRFLINTVLMTRPPRITLIQNGQPRRSERALRQGE
jgi:hypothetical protein